MKVLVTGAKGFIGRNLCSALANIRDGKDRRPKYQALLPLEIFECDVETTREELSLFCARADFVFNLAGVNRPKDPAQFMEGNFGFASELLALLERHGNRCPVMLASSAQASLEGRYAGSAYGESKLAGENLFREYSARTGAPVLIYRFPNVYGKWCRPNYNSAVATFCHNVSHGLPIRVDDPSVELELLHVDDLVSCMLDALLGEERRTDDGLFCVAGPTDRATLGEVVSLIESFRDSRRDLSVPSVEEGTLSSRLYATYMSYLDGEGLAYPLEAHADDRGFFAEFLRTPERGQISVNVSKPGIVKGNHWHSMKWEKFLVVSGEGLVRLRRVGTDREGNAHPVAEYRVDGAHPTVVEIAPGFTHSIANLSAERDLVTVMWASECFDPERPDTYHEEV